nr:hypothetical protein [Tanacetum cinerariifolium]
MWRSSKKGPYDGPMIPNPDKPTDLPSEWRTHTLIWRNKADLEEQSLDDLFNNLKIYESKVKSSSTSSQTTQNIAFVSSNNTNSTIESVNAVPSVSAASSQAPASTLPNVDSLSDVFIYSFFSSQSNSLQLENEDLKQIDADYLEEMDLKWQMAMLTMRSRRFLQKTRRNLGANGTTAIGFDMSKVECYNCHRRGHFARECRSLRDNRNKDTPRRTIPVEVSTSNALVSQCDRVGSYNWSFQANEEPTNYALMAFTSSSSSSSSGSDNEVFDCDELNSFESDDSVPTTPVHDKYKSGEGYHTVPPPYTGTFMPPKHDLVFHDAPNASKTIPDVVTVESSSTKLSKDFSKTLRPDAPIIEDWTSDSEDKSEIVASFKPVEHTKPAENLRTDNHKSRGHKNSRNRKACFVCKSLNHLIKDYDYYEKQMIQKSMWNNAMRVNHHNSARMFHSHSNGNVVPTTVLTRLGLVSINAARPVTTAVPKSIVKSPRPIKHVVNKAHTPIRRHINHIPAPRNSNFNQKVTTVKGNPQQALKDKGYVAFGGSPKGGKILGKGKIKTGKLDFDDVYFVKELKFNLFSVSQMCDKKNSVLFTDTKCVVLSFDFKLPDENHMLLRVLRENNMYSVYLKSVVPSRDLTCLFAKATLDESNLWHRRLGHINFKTKNKLVKGNLVRGLPSKVFENNHTYVACKKVKQHRASCKSKPVSSVSHPLQRLYMDLFGPTFVKSLNKKSYCLVVTDDYSRFSWVFFLATKDETSTILKTFITGIENQINHKVKIIRSDNGIEFKNHDLNQFCRMKRIKREFSVARTPQQNGVAERKNRTLIEKARTMLADSLLPIPFWAEAINTVCYVQNNVLVTKPHNKKPYELLLGNKPNHSAGIKENLDASKVRKKTISAQQYVLLPLWSTSLKYPQNIDDAAAFDAKENEDEVYVSPSSSDKPKKHNEKAKRKSKEKNMHALEDIVYSDDEEDVGVEADFSNLGTNISGRTKEEGIAYEEVFAPVVRIKAIRLFSAYASFMGFMVYKVVKARYGLHQAPRAWYETLANYLLENGFQRGKIDQTLFIKNQKRDILLVQVYVDDIIFGYTNKDLCKAFEKLMKDKFQMSSMGELTFFLGLQVKKKDDGIFISQDKYLVEILCLLFVPALDSKLLQNCHICMQLEGFLVTMLELALIGSPQQEVVNS